MSTAQNNLLPGLSILKRLCLLGSLSLLGSPTSGKAEENALLLLPPDPFLSQGLFAAEPSPGPSSLPALADSSTPSLIEENIRLLLLTRLNELSLHPSRAAKTAELCRAMHWENIPCGVLEDHTVPQETRTSSLLALQKDLSIRFASPHEVSLQKASLVNSCERNVLLTQAVPFLEEQKDIPFTRQILPKGELLPVLEDYLKRNQAPLEAIEIWTGPRELLELCLPRLGYSERVVLHSSSWENISSALLQGKRRILLLGPHEWSWIYKVQRDLLLLKQTSKQDFPILTLAPFRDHSSFYKILSRIWYFYAIRLFSPEVPNAIQLGYGPEVGTGERFFREFGHKQFKLCPAARKTFPGGSLLPYLDRTGKRKQLLFLQTSSADLLSIPIFALGELFGEKGVSELGLWGTAGGVKGPQWGEIYIPEDFRGFSFSFLNTSLVPSTLSIHNDLGDFLRKDQHLPKNVRTGGHLGSFFHSALENQEIERKMTEDWGFMGVDTDSYFLFSGFKARNPTGRTFGLFWISDVNSSGASQVPREASKNGAANAPTIKEKRNDASVTASNALLSTAYQLAEADCRH